MTGETRGQRPGLGCKKFTSRKAEGVERQNHADFEGSYSQHTQCMYSPCHQKTGSETAQGLAKEAFLRWFRKLDTFRGNARIRCYKDKP